MSPRRLPLKAENLEVNQRGHESSSLADQSPVTSGCPPLPSMPWHCRADEEPIALAPTL